MSSKPTDVPQFVADKIEFQCPGCGKSALLHPLTVPLSVQHSLPACELYKEAAAGVGDELAHYLQLAGLPVQIPERKPN